MALATYVEDSVVYSLCRCLRNKPVDSRSFFSLSFCFSLKLKKIIIIFKNLGQRLAELSSLWTLMEKFFPLFPNLIIATILWFITAQLLVLGFQHIFLTTQLNPCMCFPTFWTNHTLEIWYAQNLTLERKFQEGII